MEPVGAPMRTRIKICCIASIDEAWMAIRAGADALGLVGSMPSGPGPIADELIAEIARAVPPPVATFLLTSETDVDAVIDHARTCGTNTLQIVDRVDPSVYGEIRRALPALKMVQVIHVLDDTSVTEARELAPHVDALLLDSGNPQLKVKELGGTGRVHDWNLSRQIVESVDPPVFLAGGLNAGNVAAAIRHVRPYGVDLCSSVRTDGRLDREKLGAFMEAARSVGAGPDPR